MTPEENRENFVSELADAIISQMTFESMRQAVWDSIYEDLIWQDWGDLCMTAEEYAPDLLSE
jgi:hypothetical protein